MDFDKVGNMYLVLSAGGIGGRILKVDPVTGLFKTIAIGFDNPRGLAISKDGKALYVSEPRGVISKVDIATGKITPVLLDNLNFPQDIEIDDKGILYVSESGGKISRGDVNTGLVTTFVSGLSAPNAIKFGPDGKLYVAEGETGEPGTAKITKINLISKQKTTVVDNLRSTSGMAFNGDDLYFTHRDISNNPIISTVNILSGTVSKFADLPNFGGWIAFIVPRTNRVAFSKVTLSGTTTVTTSGTGPPAPSGFKLGSPPTYYEITTTATFSGLITISIAYNETHFETEQSLRLFHWTGTGWDDITTSLNSTTNVIQGVTTSLSPFMIGEHCCPN
jgi:sugar lactone lactonase YvrE